MDHVTHPKRIARPGTLWVCGACGKTAKDRYGPPGEAMQGWDESCMLNSWLCAEESITYGPHGRALRVEGTIEQP